MKFTERANRAKGKTANVYWDGDFECWSIVCRGSQNRNEFTGSSDGFPIDLATYRETDGERLIADLRVAIPQCNFVIKTTIW